MRVLVIEDERRLSDNIVAALREIGFAVDHAADGIEGSHLAEQGFYNAVVLDSMLPGKNGERFCRICGEGNCIRQSLFSPHRKVKKRSQTC